MNTNIFLRVAGATVAAGFATLAFALPANALIPIDPGPGPTGTMTQQPASTQPSGTDWGGLATGAMGGLALAGVGIGAVAGARRRGGHVARPA